jgi:hypothetical protein
MTNKLNLNVVRVLKELKTFSGREIPRGDVYHRYYLKFDGSISKDLIVLDIKSGTLCQGKWKENPEAYLDSVVYTGDNSWKVQIIEPSKESWTPEFKPKHVYEYLPFFKYKF